MERKAWFEKEIVPRVRADGGWLEITDADADTAAVTAKGECAHCAALERCLKWIEACAERDLSLQVRFTVTRDPFLWRK